MLATVVIQSAFAWFWFALTCLITVVWLRRHVDLARARSEKVLTAADADPPVANPPPVDSLAGNVAGKSAGDGTPAATDPLPSLTMLVAAKDEQANIGRCIDGLLKQDYPNLQLIFANDRSTDRTPQLIDAAAARDSRVTAVHVKALAPGWFGKNNAMRCGVERATGAWLCFSDADCAFESPRLLTAAMRLALAEKADLLSVLPRLEANTFWERVVQPVAGAVLVFWFLPQRVNSPAKKTAYANGAFMLMSRQAYDAIGGHEPVKTQVNEDMHMARLIKEAGRRLLVVRSSGLYSVRMYTGFAQIWRGWSRIFYGCFGTLPRLLVSLVFLSVFSLSPYFTLLLSPLAGPAATWFALAAGAAVVAQQSVLWRFWALQGLPSYWAVSYPLGAAICTGMIVNAITKLGGVTRTTWRGTTYRGQTLDAPGQQGNQTSEAADQQTGKRLDSAAR